MLYTVIKHKTNQIDWCLFLTYSFNETLLSIKNKTPITVTIDSLRLETFNDWYEQDCTMTKIEQPILVHSLVLF